MRACGVGEACDATTAAPASTRLKGTDRGNITVKAVRRKQRFTPSAFHDLKSPFHESATLCKSDRVQKESLSVVLVSLVANARAVDRIVFRAHSTMDDPSQSANAAAGRQDRALQEKYRAQIQEGALTGFEERNSKWDVEYEGKDAVGTLVRPFEPGFGDARRLPEKMLGETNIMAVMRSMGRNMPHSGAGDGTKVFNTEDDPERLRKMIKEEVRNALRLFLQHPSPGGRDAAT